jgi:hypothetical protein
MAERKRTDKLTKKAPRKKLIASGFAGRWQFSGFENYDGVDDESTIKLTARPDMTLSGDRAHRLLTRPLKFDIVHHALMKQLTLSTTVTNRRQVCQTRFVLPCLINGSPPCFLMRVMR